MSAEAESEVLVEQRGQLGIITLNRPRAINALTHGMVTVVAAQLSAWEGEESIRTIAITGAGERGLCAGGDVVSLQRAALEADSQVASDFLFDEYHLNAQIARYPKPVLAVQDGIVLGGGIGISAHASHRVVTERSRLGMPEVSIGVVPDVGGTWLLSRAPGELGTYLALTAESARAADAITIGLSDVYMPSSAIPELLTDLESMDVDDAIRPHEEDPGIGPLSEARNWIDACFAADEVEEILRRLRGSPESAAQDAASLISAKSPTALAVTLRALRTAARLGSLEEALGQEYRLARRAFATADFIEGVRALMIDKDKNPRWVPADRVDDALIDSFFAPLPDRELGLIAPAASPLSESGTI